VLRGRGLQIAREDASRTANDCNLDSCASVAWAATKRVMPLMRRGSPRPPVPLGGNHAFNVAGSPDKRHSPAPAVWGISKIPMDQKASRSVATCVGYSHRLWIAPGMPAPITAFERTSRACLIRGESRPRRDESPHACPRWLLDVWAATVTSSASKRPVILAAAPRTRGTSVNAYRFSMAEVTHATKGVPGDADVANVAEGATEAQRLTAAAVNAGILHI
jgi:hypothetical protein